jgi:hypothetical protein
VQPNPNPKRERGADPSVRLNHEARMPT